MTTTGRAPQPDSTPPSLQSSTPLRELLGSMLGMLLGEITDGAGSDQLRRFVDPLALCLALDRDLTDQADAAHAAVSQVRSQHMADLATGVIMARMSCDAATARVHLTQWLSREGIEARSLTPGEVRSLLDEPDWGRR